MGVPPNRMSEIVRGRRGITTDTAIKLSRVLGTTVEFWTNLQNEHDISRARCRAEEKA